MHALVLTVVLSFSVPAVQPVKRPAVSATILKVELQPLPAKRAAKRVVRKKARSGKPARVEPHKAKPADGATPNTDGVITQLVKVVPAPVGKPLEARPTKRTKTKRVERRWVPEPVRVNHYHGGFSY